MLLTKPNYVVKIERKTGEKTVVKRTLPFWPSISIKLIESHVDTSDEKYTDLR